MVRRNQYSRSNLLSADGDRRLEWSIRWFEYYNVKSEFAATTPEVHAIAIKYCIIKLLLVIRVWYVFGAMLACLWTSHTGRFGNRLHQLSRYSHEELHPTDMVK